MNTETFTGRAKAYSKGRPGYPEEAIGTYVHLCRTMLFLPILVREQVNSHS